MSKVKQLQGEPYITYLFMYDLFNSAFSDEMKYRYECFA